MDGSSQSRRLPENSRAFSQAHILPRHNAESTDYVGITIADELPQRQSTLLHSQSTTTSQGSPHKEQLSKQDFRGLFHLIRSKSDLLPPPTRKSTKHYVSVCEIGLVPSLIRRDLYAHGVSCGVIYAIFSIAA